MRDRATVPRRPRYRAAAQTAAPSRACHPLRLPPSPRIVGVGGRPFNPDVAPVEEFTLPDRRDLLHALDRVAARRVGVAAVRRSYDNRDACLADLEPADAMVQGQPRARPPLSDFRRDARERFQRKRLVPLVLKISDAPPHGSVAPAAQTTHHPPAPPSRRAARTPRSAPPPA